MQIVPNLKKTKQTSKKLYLTMQITLSVRKKPYIPTLTILIYIFQYCCINMFCRNGTMLVCTFLLRCSVVCKTKNETFYTFLFSFFSTYRTQFLKPYLVRQKIKKCALTELSMKKLSNMTACVFLKLHKELRFSQCILN